MSLHSCMLPERTFYTLLRYLFLFCLNWLQLYSSYVHIFACVTYIALNSLFISNTDLENAKTENSDSIDEPSDDSDSKSTAGKHFTFTGTFLNSLTDQQPGVESDLAAASAGGGAFTGSGLFLDKREKLELLRILLGKDLQS
ncbi:uncharacterized protein LOC128559099 [Mercenaria mercenaria]|uniref:uncharacterized protein LOC128559099 n=1 Tax=Mercenaria mercenaria TaxID=6596 RepID=UPI00234EF80E|nr:uncharacterized protein LOC128559099 [Mercenaria mercenaria]